MRKHHEGVIGNQEASLTRRHWKQGGIGNKEALIRRRRQRGGDIKEKEALTRRRRRRGGVSEEAATQANKNGDVMINNNVITRKTQKIII